MTPLDAARQLRTAACRLTAAVARLYPDAPSSPPTLDSPDPASNQMLVDALSNLAMQLHTLTAYLAPDCSDPDVCQPLLPEHRPKTPPETDAQDPM